MFIDGKGEDRTLGIGTDRHCSLEHEKHVIREAKSRRIDREYYREEMEYGDNLYHLIKRDNACIMGVLGSRQSRGLVVQMEHMGAFKKDRISCDWRTD